MLGSLLDTTAIDGFVDRVANALTRRLPPDQVERHGTRTDARRAQFDRELEDEVRRLVTEARPNLYQKAKLGTRLQRVLQARGYPGAFSRDLAFDVVRRVAASAAADRASR